MSSAYARNEISSFVSARLRPYVHPVAKERMKKGSDMTKFTIPSGEQLYAYEQQARRERARTQARMLAAAVRWVGNAVKAALFRPYARRPMRKAAFHG
jgi:hypothetical protein